MKIGTDDYVTKPSIFMELMARVEALLHHTSRQPDDYSFGDVVVNFKSSK